MLLGHVDLASDWSYAGVAALGAFHGVNPAMGWLFAVAFGLQQGSRRALLLALVLLAIGHELSVLPTLVAVEELHVFASDTAIRIAGAAALGAFGLWKLVRAHAHHRWVGMRLRYRELVLWSFLMASAHGAGLMLMPFVVGIYEAQGGSIDSELARLFEDYYQQSFGQTLAVEPQQTSRICVGQPPDVGTFGPFLPL